MRPIPVTPRETFDYVLESNRKDPEDQQVRFRLTTPTVEEDAIYVDMTHRMAIGTQSLSIVRAHLKGWDNWPEATFESDEKGHPKNETLKLLGPKVLVELARAVMDSSYPDEEQKGK